VSPRIAAPVALAAEFGMVLLGILLFGERTWKHHAVTLCVPFAVLAYALAALTRPIRWRLGALLAAAVLCMLSTSSGLWLGNDRLADLAMVYGAYVWAFFLLLIALAVVLRADLRRRFFGVGARIPDQYSRSLARISLGSSRMAARGPSMK
jgi:hypothetical protein